MMSKTIHYFVRSSDLVCTVRCYKNREICSAAKYDEDSKDCTLGWLDRGRYNVVPPSTENAITLTSQNTPNDGTVFSAFNARS